MLLTADIGQAPTILAKYGPPADQVPVFCWDKFFQKAPHIPKAKLSYEGQPNCFNFTWEVMPPIKAKY